MSAAATKMQRETGNCSTWSKTRTKTETSGNVTLSRRQYAVLRAILDFIEANGYGPSFREIGRSVGVTSIATVHSHVHGIEKKGYIKYSGPRAFAILKPLR